MSAPTWLLANNRELREIQAEAVEALEEARQDLEQINAEIRKRQAD